MASIAVIDDIPANRELLVTVLSAMGHACLEAADGAAALKLVKLERPELVICDVLMPVMDGYEFMRLLRMDPDLSAIPVIFYTAHYFEDEARRLAQACGVSDFLAKPCEPEDILQVVNRVLSMAAPSPAAASPGEFESRHLELVTGKLTQKVTDLENANRRLAAQFDVAHILAQAENFQDACRPVLETICTQLGFTAGGLWRADEQGRALTCLEFWCHPDASCVDFAAGSRHLVFLPGAGVVGRVWSRGRGLWLHRLERQPFFLRGQEAAAAGLAAGAVIPIPGPGACAGVLEFFTTRAGGPPPGLMATLLTITGQVSQFFIRQSQHERILRLNRMHAVLSGINSAIVRVRDREELLHEACRIAVEAGHFGMAWIGELDETGTTLRAAAWAGMTDEVGAKPAALDSARPRGRKTLLGRTLERGKAIVVNDLEREDAASARLAEALRRGYRSAICLPLTVQGQATGVLCLYVPEAGFFNAEEMELLVELAGDVSYALEFIGQQDRLAWMSHHDLLTGLANRSLLLERTSQAIQAARQHGKRLGVAAIDVNRFRNVNDSLGRPAGDALLKEMARRLAAAWPQAGHVARLAANEFGALVDDAEDFPHIAHVLERAMLATFSRPYTLEGRELRLAAACGVAIFPDDGEDAESLFRNAEAALRRAKETNMPYAFYRPDMNARVADLLMLESRLRRAVEREEFVLHYQPKQNLESGRTTSFEALIRWNDPENGLIPPEQFVHLLEETGLILPVGAWAIRRVLEDGRRWLEDGATPPRIAVNVSPIQLQQADFIDSTRDALSVLLPERPWMDLELTESMIMSDIEHNVPRLSTIRGMGLGIAIDDFGTGYSSLGYLTRLPVNALKIDRSFIVTMLTSPESMTIVSTIITLAHSLGMKVIAEGVEEEEQARILRLLKCDELQGFLLSPAVPPERMREFLHA